MRGKLRASDSMAIWNSDSSAIGPGRALPGTPAHLATTRDPNLSGPAVISCRMQVRPDPASSCDALRIGGRQLARPEAVSKIAGTKKLDAEIAGTAEDAEKTLRFSALSAFYASCFLIFMRRGYAPHAWKTASKIERTPSNSRKQPLVFAKARRLRSPGTAGVSPALFQTPSDGRSFFAKAQQPVSIANVGSIAFSCAMGARVAHGKLLRK